MAGLDFEALLNDGARNGHMPERDRVRWAANAVQTELGRTLCQETIASLAGLQGGKGRADGPHVVRQPLSLMMLDDHPRQQCLSASINNGWMRNATTRGGDVHIWCYFKFHERTAGSSPDNDGYYRTFVRLDPAHVPIHKFDNTGPDVIEIPVSVRALKTLTPPVVQPPHSEIMATCTCPNYTTAATPHNQKRAGCGHIHATIYELLGGQMGINEPYYVEVVAPTEQAAFDDGSRCVPRRCWGYDEVVDLDDC